MISILSYCPALDTFFGQKPTGKINQNQASPTDMHQAGRLCMGRCSEKLSIRDSATGSAWHNNCRMR